MPLLRRKRKGLRRLSLPGLHADRRCQQRRPGVQQVGRTTASSSRPARRPKPPSSTIEQMTFRNDRNSPCHRPRLNPSARPRLWPPVPTSPNSKVSADGLFWIEFRPADGACRIWHLAVPPGPLPDPGWLQRAQPGLRIWRWQLCLGGDGLVFVNEKDQQVYTQPLDGGAPRALTQDASCRYGDVQWHAGPGAGRGGTPCRAGRASLVALTAQSSHAVLAEGADFYRLTHRERRWPAPGVDRMGPPGTALDHAPD